jgi:hypothetical protein
MKQLINIPISTVFIFMLISMWWNWLGSETIRNENAGPVLTFLMLFSSAGLIASIFHFRLQNFGTIWKKIKNAYIKDNR